MSWDEYFDRWFQRRMRRPFGLFNFDFEDIDVIFEKMFREMTENLPKELIRERRLSDGRTIREMGPFVYGYSMTLGPDGKPVIREFGNVKHSNRPASLGTRRSRLEYRPEREPLVDVLEDADNVRVIAELPGVEKEDIKLRCTERQLYINVDAPNRNYYKDVELPSDVDPMSSKASYKNGVLEVILSKNTERSNGEYINIE